MRSNHTAQDNLREGGDQQQAEVAPDLLGLHEMRVAEPHRPAHLQAGERALGPLPSALAVAVVNALEKGPLDIDELIMSLRQKRVLEVGHVFNSEVGLAVEFLKGRSVVAEEARDCTEKVLKAPTPRPPNQSTWGFVQQNRILTFQGDPSFISLYAQKQSGAARRMRLVPAGVFCLRCLHTRIDM